MAIITGTLTLVFWIVIAGVFLYRWLCNGYNAIAQIGLKEIALGLYVVLVLVGPPTLIAAVFGAVTMGIGGGVGYRQQSAQPEVDDRSE